MNRQSHPLLVIVLLGSGFGALLCIVLPLAAPATGGAVTSGDLGRWCAGGALLGFCVAVVCIQVVSITGRVGLCSLVGAVTGGVLSFALVAGVEPW